LGQSHIVRFERTGPRVLLIASNEAFRANSDNADERRAVKDAFAESTLWGFEVAAEEANRALVDATAFYLRDVHGIPGTLQRSQQGQFRLDPTRCSFYLANTKNFPKNSEVETTLTFTTEGEAGPLVRSVTPVAQAITVREHVSFVELPPAGFKPRVNDPRAGEIIQGRVSLGSLRDRQDFLIAEGLLAPYGKDKTVVDKIMQQVVLARLRQLAAHEVGHTLGLQHNFAASTTNRASVM